MTEESKFNWPPLESNPEVFTNYMHKVGMSKEWAVGEVFGFDEDLLAFLPQPIIGVIVAIERTDKAGDKEHGSEDNVSKVPFYMKQTNVLDNACGVIACLHAVLNKQEEIKIDGDSILGKYYSAVKDQSPIDRALTLEKDESFQQEHKGYASEGQSNQASEQSEVKHHFVAFIINKDKQLIELDGLKKGPNIIEEGCEDVLRGSIKEI